MAHNERNKIIMEVADWISSHGAKEFPYWGFCDDFFREDETDDNEIELMDAMGFELSVSQTVVHLLVAVALGVDDKILGEMAKNFGWNSGLFTQLNDLGNVGVELFGKRINHTDLAIAFMRGLVANDSWLLGEIGDFNQNPQREVALTHINRADFWLKSRLLGQGELSRNEDPTDQGHEIPFKIRCVDHLPNKSLSTLIDRLGGFTNEVIRYKVEQYGQWEAMIMSFFWAKVEGPETIALRKAFIDLAEGPYGAKFLHALGSVSAFHAELPDELIISLYNLKKMAGAGSPIFQVLEDPVVIANTDCVLPYDFSEYFQIQLLERLATYDPKEFGVSQAKALTWVTDDVLASQVQKAPALVSRMANCLENLGYQDNEPEGDEAVLQKPDDVISSLSAAKTLLINSIINLTRLSCFDFKKLDSLTVGQQDALALGGLPLKQLKSVSARVKGKILMNELGL